MAASTAASVKVEGAVASKRKATLHGTPDVKRLKEDDEESAPRAAPNERVAVETMERQAAYYVANPEEASVKQLEVLLEAANRWLTRLQDDAELTARTQTVALQIDRLLPSLRMIEDAMMNDLPLPSECSSSSLSKPPDDWSVPDVCADQYDGTALAAVLHEALRHDAARTISQFLRCRGAPQPLDELDVMEASLLVDWDTQYQLELGPLRQFLEEAAQYPEGYFTLEEGVVMVKSHPPWVVRTRAPLISNSKMRSRLWDLYRGGLRAVEDLDKGVFATIMEREQKLQFRTPIEVPIPVRVRFEALNNDPAKAEEYIDAVKEWMHWYGPLPAGPQDWLSSRLPAAIAQRTGPPAHRLLTVFACIWSALKMVLFIRVQFLSFAAMKKKPQSHSGGPRDSGF